jgi:hypothetical protein
MANAFSRSVIAVSFVAVFYDPFFLRSAQRRFIARDKRLLPAGVMPPRFLPFVARLPAVFAGVAESLESKAMA